MKMRLLKKALSVSLSLLLLLSCITAAIPNSANSVEAEAAGEQYVCLGYLADWMFNSQSDLQAVDFKKLTHVNFAFSTVNASTYLPEIGSPAKLTAIVNEIKRQGADTKVFVSIGGWGAGNFCEACNSDSRRAAFAATCASWFDTYGIDGIDLDWEYPGSSDAGISSCSNCKTDYTKLCQAIRDAIGDDKLLTMAGGASSYRASQIECAKLAQILDFVNLMNYDYDTNNHASFSVTKTSAAAWVAAGFSKKQINIGIPYYARSSSSTWNWMNYVDIMPSILNGSVTVTTTTDESYGMANGSKISFDTPEQIYKKMQWVKEEGYGGAMCWELMQDYNGDLLSTMYSHLNGDGTYNSPYIPINGLSSSSTGVVTNFRATSIGQTSISLAWSAPSSGAASYKVYNGNTLLGTTTSTSYTVNNLTAATSYTFKVVAVGSDSSESAAVSVTVSTADPDMRGTLLSQNKTVIVSSVEENDSQFAGSMAVDGNEDTRWASQYSNSEYITIDLGSECTVQTIRLLWEAAYATGYRLEVSTDNTNWTSVYTTTTGDGGTDVIFTDDVKARYVRMYGTQRSTSYGFSLYEFQVYGVAGSTGEETGVTNPVTNLIASPSTTSVTLSWSASSNATSYKVYNGDTLLGTTSSTSYTVSGLTAGTAYTFRVVATGTNGDASAVSVSTTTATNGSSSSSYEAWDSAKEYTQGDTVVYNGSIYTAKWWSQGDVPGEAEWGPWEYVGEDNTTTEPTYSISLSKTSTTITEGETDVITATVSPSGTAVTWTTSNGAVATVSNGVITGVAAGTATITATAGTASATVTVTVEAVPVTETEATTLFKINCKTVYKTSSNAYEKESAAVAYIGTRSYAPLRAGGNAAGFEVLYVSDNEIILTAANGDTYTLAIGSKTVKTVIGGVAGTTEMTHAAELVNGKTYVPLRAITLLGETYGYGVEYMAYNDGEYVFVTSDASLLGTATANETARKSFIETYAGGITE